jgi:hypothetical protein
VEAAKTEQVGLKSQGANLNWDRSDGEVGSIAQLPEPIVSPAPDFLLNSDGAGVAEAGRDLSSRRKLDNLTWKSVIFVRAIAELTGVIAAPTLYPT